MKQLCVLLTSCVLAISGCKNDSGSTIEPGNTIAFKFVSGRTWTYNGQSYQTNGSPISNSSFQTSLAVQSIDQNIGGIANAAVLNMVSSQGSSSKSSNFTAALNQNVFMIYNGAVANPHVSPS